MSIGVLLVDDHKITRQGLRSMIEKENDLEVIGEAEDGREALDLAKENSPDVVVMDISMPDLNGIEATRMILDECPNSRVLALSMHADRRFAAGIFSAGAKGYLLKDCAFDEVVEAIRTVSQGRAYLSPDISEVMLDDYVDRLGEDGDESAFSVLTDRQREVLQLLAEGQTTRQIAQELDVSVKTIESHRQNIMEKLDIHNVAELTKYAVREGLTSLD